MDYTLTEHAFERAKERLKFDREKLERVFETACNDGWDLLEIKNIFPKVYKHYQKHLNRKCRKDGDRILIYKSYAFFLHKNVLKTVMKIPYKLRRDSKGEHKSGNKKQEREEKRKFKIKIPKAFEWWNKLTKEQRKEYHDEAARLTTFGLVELYDKYSLSETVDISQN